LGIDLETAFANLGTVIDTTVPAERRAALPPVVLGTSGGGIAALVFSGFYPVRNVVIVGPNSTRDVRWSANPQLERVLESRRRAASDGNEVPVTVVYGEMGNDAHKVSDWKSDIAGAALIEIPGAEHNALLPLAEEGTLLSNLREWINPASPSRKKRP
jgi:pimeloyl-ACP methyl ester carboxylesterase